MINWTFDRPTEPGEYWLSIAPDQRDANEPATEEVTVKTEATTGDLCVAHEGHVQFMSNLQYDGAQWAKRETPADPFATA